VFFDEFAKEEGFDPFKPENWYKAGLRRLKNRRVPLDLEKTDLTIIYVMLS